MRRTILCAALALFCLQGLSLSVASSGPVKAYTFAPEKVPAELADTAMQVHAGDTVIRLTFAGDCTLGGMANIAGSAKSFGSMVERYGMDYPFAKLRQLFAADDFTAVNLEGVLSDQALDKEPGKRFHFIGHPSYAAILRLGSVECVNLANNHTFDYGLRGYADTKAALEEADIAYFGEDAVTVLEKEGIRIGFTGSLFALGGSRRETLDRQLKALKSVGCQWIVHTLHGGEEYASMPTAHQRSAAQYAADNGVSLVVGHHPHVVQGMEMLGETPVLYSLGNCSFGGNFRPRDMDACILRVELSFCDGQPNTMRMTLYPIRISGEKRSNNFQPVLLEGEDAERVMAKLRNSSSVELAPYVEGQGAVQPLVEYKGEGHDPGGEDRETRSLIR